MFGNLFRKKPDPESSFDKCDSEVTFTNAEETVFRLKAESASSIKEIDTRFMGMLMGINSLIEGDLKPSEKKALAQIRNWSQQKQLPDGLVPRLPSVIPKIMMAVRNENTTAQQLADIVTEDLSLVGEVIRLSNSAFYRTGEKIESLKQAIVKLGMNGIRQLISGAAFKPILNPEQGKLSRVLSQYLWDKNQKAALAGNFIALHTEDDRFHAYLAGLLAQAGILVIIKQLEQSFDTLDIPRTRVFMHELDALCKLITVQLSRQWEMPEEVTEALQEQLNEKVPVGMSSLGSVCYVSDRLAKISILEARGQFKDMGEEIQCDVGKIKTNLCKQCYRFINLDQAR